MPTSIAIAVGADMIGAAVADAVIFDIAMATTFDWVATYGVIQAGSSFVAGSIMRSALSGGAETTPSTPAFASQAEQRTHIIRSAIANRQIIYGRAAVSGPLIFAASSTDNNTLHLVISLAGHEVDALEEVWFGDDLVGTRATVATSGTPGTPETPAWNDEFGNYHPPVPATPGTPGQKIGDVLTGDYAGYAQIKLLSGSDNQTADADLIAANVGWTAAHRLQGTAALYVKLTYSRDKFPRGIPNIKAQIRGKKLYDPRTGITAWSDNVALAVRDYLTSSYGLGSDDAEMDDTALIAAANLCDEAVTLAGGGTEARYTCNGVFDLGQTPRSIMEALLSGCGGALTWPAGLWTLNVASYTSPVMSLDEDDLAGGVQVRARVPRQDLYNAIKGTYVDPDKSWQPTDFPPITNATYAAQDGAQIFRDIALPVTTSPATAQRLAKIMVEKSRQGITVQVPLKLTAFKVATWDNVSLSLSALGWSSKVFKVTGWTFAENGSVNLTLQEEAAACYTWSAEETAIDPAPDTTLSNGLSVEAPGRPSAVESLFETTGSAGVKVRVSMAWTSVNDGFVIDYLPEYRASGGEWVVLPATAGLGVEINDIAPGDYEFRLRARNAIGVRSAYSDTGALTVIGLSAAPSDVAGFSVIASNGVAIGAWTLSPDLDVRLGGRIVIRWTPITSGAIWENGIDVGEFNGDAATALLPMLTGTYLAKAKDSSGNWSATAASFVLTAGSLTALPNSLTLTEHSAFTGAKSDTLVIDGSLTLDGAIPVDSITDLIDTWSYIDSPGGVASSGTYDFSAPMDFGSVVTRRITPSIHALASDVIDLIDERGPVDDWDSTDGLIVNDATVALLAAISTDAVSYGSWFPLLAGDVTCRAIKFRLALASASPTHNIGISQLEVTANW